MPPAQKDIILLHGNCHSVGIQSFLASLPEFADEYDFVIFPYAKEGARTGKLRLASARKTLADFAAQNRARIKIVLNGVTQNHLQESLDKTVFAPDTVIIDHPTPLVNFLWPLSSLGGFRDIAEARSHDDVTGLDSLLLRIRAPEMPEDELLCRYKEADVVSGYKVDALYRINSKVAEHIDSVSSFPIWPVIAKNLRICSVHSSFGHPGGVVFAEILRNVCALSGKIRDRHNLDDKLAIVKRGPGVQPANEIPVHPAIAEHFGLSWAKDRAFNYFGRYLTCDEYILHIHRFMDENLYYARDRFHRTGDPADIIAAYNAKVSKYPQDPYFCDELAGHLARAGKQQEALAHAQQAYELLPDAHRGLFVRRLLLGQGQNARANELLKELRGRFPMSLDVGMAHTRHLLNRKLENQALAHLQSLESGSFMRPERYQLYCLKAQIARMMGNVQEVHRNLRYAYYLKSGKKATLLNLQKIEPTFSLPMAGTF